MYLLINKKQGIIQLIKNNTWDDFLSNGIYVKPDYINNVKNNVKNLQELVTSIKITNDVYCFLLNIKVPNNHCGIIRFNTPKYCTFLLLNGLNISSYLCKAVAFVKIKTNYSHIIKRKFVWFSLLFLCLFFPLKDILITNIDYNSAKNQITTTNKVQASSEIIKAIQRLSIEKRVSSEKDFVFDGELIRLGDSHPVYFLPLGNSKYIKNNAISQENIYAIIASTNKATFLSHDSFKLYEYISTQQCANKFIFTFTHNDLLFIIYNNNNNTRVQITPWSTELDKQSLNTKCLQEMRDYYDKSPSTK